MATQTKDHINHTFSLSPFPIFQKMFRSLSHFLTFSLSRFHTCNGFTLIEVMIAIAIIAIALVVILHSYGLGVSMANESQDFSLATLFAQEKMAEIEIEGFPEIGEKKGDFGEEYPGFIWGETVTKTPIEDLRKVTLTISWDEKNLEVITYIARKE